MKNTMEYKGYTGSVEYSGEGSNAEELRKDFRDGVDDYLAMCEEKNIPPSSHSRDHSTCGLAVIYTGRSLSKRRDAA